MIKDDKFFDKYKIIWKKVGNIIKQINSELIYNKEKAKKRFNRKKNFQCFYIPVILFDSVYRKDRNYNVKVFLKNLFITSFGEI